MHKKNIKLFLIIGAIILCCFFSTIAYSALYSTMEISGMAYARPVKDVRITDFRLSSSNNATSQYEEFGVNSISMKYNFSEESSSILYDVEVTNYGNVDVGLFDLYDAIDNYPNVRCDIYNQIPGEKICDDNGKCNNMAVKTFQIGCSGLPGEYEQTITFDFREYHSVTYTGITNNNYPTEVMDGAELNVDFTEPLKRIAVYQNGEKVAYYPTVYQGSNLLLASVKGNIEIKQEEPVARLVSGKIDEVGSEVCIKEECFYVISSTDTTVTMLAKYNLHVGNSVDSDWNVTPLASPTGIQDKTAKGYDWDNENGVEIFPFIGTTAFSSDSQKGTNYSDYSGSIVEGYVNNYNSYLITQGVTPIEARLITKDELIGLGCSEDDYRCSSAPSWVYATSYWSGSADDTNYVCNVNRDTYFDFNYYYEDSAFGVRPVIEMSVDDIYVEPAAKVISGDYDTVGSEVAIGDEHFYVISSTEDTVTMLAKYNLHVGNSVDENWNITPLSSPTGIQNVIAKGYVWDNENGDKVFPFIGTTAFSDISTDYSGSIVEGYVDNYSNYLSSLGVTLVDSRLLYSEEACSLGCELYESPGGLEGSCNSAPNFVYSTSYWIISGSSFALGELGIINSGTVSTSNISNNYDYGVRPVITISKDYF